MKRARSWSIEHTFFVLIVGIPLLFYACINWMAHEEFELLQPVESFDGVTVQIVYVEQGYHAIRIIRAMKSMRK